MKTEYEMVNRLSRDGLGDMIGIGFDEFRTIIERRKEDETICETHLCRSLFRFHYGPLETGFSILRIEGQHNNSRDIASAQPLEGTLNRRVAIAHRVFDYVLIVPDGKLRGDFL